jgi:hypothetical protein
MVIDALPIKVGESDLGVLITDRCHGPFGDVKKLSRLRKVVCSVPDGAK